MVCAGEKQGSQYKLGGPMVQKGAVDWLYYIATFLGSSLFVNCTNLTPPDKAQVTLQLTASLSNLVRSWWGVRKNVHWGPNQLSISLVLAKILPEVSAYMPSAGIPGRFCPSCITSFLLVFLVQPLMGDTIWYMDGGLLRLQII